MQEDDERANRISNQADRLLLLEKVRAIVMEAAAAGGTLQVGPHARRLSESYEAAGLTRRSITDELILFAAQAGVPIEIDRSD